MFEPVCCCVPDPTAGLCPPAAEGDVEDMFGLVPIAEDEMVVLLEPLVTDTVSPGAGDGAPQWLVPV